MLALATALLFAADISQAQSDRLLTNETLTVTPGSPEDDRVLGRVTLQDSTLRIENGAEVKTGSIGARGDSTLAVTGSSLQSSTGIFFYGNPDSAAALFTVSDQAQVAASYLHLRLAAWRVDDSRVTAEALQLNGASVAIRAGSKVQVSSPRFGWVEIFDEQPSVRPVTLLIEGQRSRLTAQALRIDEAPLGVELDVRQGGLLSIGGAIEWNRGGGGPVLVSVDDARLLGAAGLWAGGNTSLALSQGGTLQLGQPLTLAGGRLIIGGRITPAAPGVLQVPSIELRSGPQGEVPSVELNHTADAYELHTQLRGAGSVVHLAGHTIWRQPLMTADLTVAGGRVSLSDINAMGALVLAPGARLVLLPGSQTRAQGRLDISGALTVPLNGSTNPAQAPLATAQRAHLDGAHLWVDAASGASVGQSYAVLAADQGIQGQFAQVDLLQPLAYLQLQSRHTANQVTVMLEKIAPLHHLTPPGAAQTVAQIIDSLPPGDLLYQHVLHLPAGTQGRVLPALSGDTLATMRGALRKVPQPAAAAHRRLHAAAHSALPLWVLPVSAWQHESGRDDRPALEARSKGLFLGGDTALGPDWRAGIALGYVNMRIAQPERAARTKGDAYAALFYGGRHWPGGSGLVTLSASVGHIWHALHSRRDMRVVGLDHTLRARWRGAATHAELQLAYGRPLNEDWTVVPYLAINLEHLRMPGYREHGGISALRHHASAAWQGRSTLGLRANWQRDRARWWAGLGWQRRAGDLTPRASVSFAHDTRRYVAHGLPQVRDTAVLEAGLDLALGADSTLALSYQAWLAGGSRQQEAFLAWRWRY